MGSYSYRQPPRCSHCWQRGHTKNHCPDIAQAAKDGQDWAIRYINAQKQSTKNRKCSYCKEQGHNKRGCHKLKEDKAFYDKIVKEFITTSLEEMNKSNLGAGSLISYKPTSTLVNCETATVAYITEIVTKNRKPTWQWLAKRFRGKGQEEEAFDRFVGYSDLHSHSDIVFKIQSVTGTGLGYWGDSDTCWVEYENFKREAEKGSESRIKLLG
jgi:hypothetical protein